MASQAGIPANETSGKSIGSPQVRFASANEEFDAPIAPISSDRPTTERSETDEEKFKELSQNLRNAQLQGRRMSQFAFEPVSLPASRVPSNEDVSSQASRHNTQSSSNRQSPHQSRPSSMHSPPITPAATRSRDAVDGTKGPTVPLRKVEAEEDSAAITPQISGPDISPSSTSANSPRAASVGSTGVYAPKPTRRSVDGSSSALKHHGGFSIGPRSHDSEPTTREPSPSRQPPINTFTRPFTPSGDAHDPYAASKRLPQSKNLDAIDQRFKFTALGSKARGSTSSLPRSNTSKSQTESLSDKRHSSLFSKDHDESSTNLQHKHGSMSELKRFLKIGGHHKAKRAASPTPSAKSGTKTPPHHKTPATQVPFDDNHGLTSRYGKFGKILGAGAGGSVRLMKRSSDGTTFAVKEFRARHSYETEKEYAKKVTAEFCVGSTLHHGNIIETLDIVQEKGKWYEVMEYAPFDLFAIVMTGKMSREEVSCCFLQILSGVTYLHSMGLAHRDLKLDNVVVNDQGIMKIIDFGSASVFKYPFENGITLASGIVGSDPYLAPEVYDERKYDPQPADIWSLAIIFCCMSLRRFPWKMPRVTDNSFKLFAATPTPGYDVKKPSETPVPSKSTSDLNTPARDSVADGTTAKPAAPEGEKKAEVIKGPWRLLRLLPRESRHIIGRMLELDPKQRATMAEVLEDAWISGTVICRQDVGGAVTRAPGHEHTLEPPAPQSASNTKG